MKSKVDLQANDNPPLHWGSITMPSRAFGVPRVTPLVLTASILS